MIYGGCKKTANMDTTWQKFETVKPTAAIMITTIDGQLLE